MRVVLAAAAAAWAATAFAAPNQKISGTVADAAGYAASAAIVGMKASTSPNASSVLADADAYAVSDGYGRYQLQCVGGKTYNLTATQVVVDAGGAITRVSLPSPLHRAVTITNINDVQGLEVARPGVPLPLTASAGAGDAAQAVDGSVYTAWEATAADPAANRWVAVDLGAPTYLAQALLWWRGAAPAGYRLQACDDCNAAAGTGSWQDVYVTTAGKACLLSWANNSALSIIQPAAPVRARYLRVLVDAFTSAQTSAALNDLTVVAAPAMTGAVTDAAGRPVAGAAVGPFLDGGPWVMTDAAGAYTLPLPYGKAVIGAHKEGNAMSGPRWLDTSVSPHADFVLFPAGPNLVAGAAPSFSPSAAAGNADALTDGRLDTLWTSGRSAIVSPVSPTWITFTLPKVTISDVEIHWKNAPTAWHLELTNDITYNDGSSPHASSRTYYSAGENGAPPETGGYVSAADPTRKVNAIHFAPVYDVTTLTVVVTGSANADPISAFDIRVSGPQATGVSDAAAAMRIGAGLQALPDDYNAVFRWNARKDDNRIDMFDAIELIRDLSREVKPLRVLVVNYQPYIEQTVTVNGGTLAGVPLRQVTGWNNPYLNTAGHAGDLELASHDFLRICLLPQIEADEYPVFTNGFQFTDDTYLTAWRTNTWPAGSADFNVLFRRFDLIRRVAVGDVDEVWLQAVPGMAMPETIMAGPNAYWCNSSPVYPRPGESNGQRLFVTTCFNYERGNDVMLEDWGHRCESILGNRKVYGGWNSASGRTTFDRFTRFDKITPGEAECGNVHYPPNGIADYDFANTTLVSSNADDWLNYPNFTGARTMVNRENWAGPWPGDYHRNYHIWWFSRFPHIPGFGPDGKLANWWKYVVDMNTRPESR